MHCNTLTTILRSLWFFSNTNLIFGKTILRIDISSNDSYTLATATRAALCTKMKENREFSDGHVEMPYWFNDSIALTCTWMVVLSNALNNSGRTSDRISSRGVFSNITWRFSNMVTVAWIDFGAANTALRTKIVVWMVRVARIVFVWKNVTWMLAKWCSRIRWSWPPLRVIVPVVEQLQAPQQHASLAADRAIRVATKVSNHIKWTKCHKHEHIFSVELEGIKVGCFFAFNLRGEWMAKLHAKYFDKNVPSVLDPSYLSHLKIASHAQRDHWNKHEPTNKFIFIYVHHYTWRSSLARASVCVWLANLDEVRATFTCSCTATQRTHLKYLINCKSCAVGRDAGSLHVKREIASCSGIGTRGNILCTESSNWIIQRTRKRRGRRKNKIRHRMKWQTYAVRCSSMARIHLPYPIASCRWKPN